MNWFQNLLNNAKAAISSIGQPQKLISPLVEASSPEPTPGTEQWRIDANGNTVPRFAPQPTPDPTKYVVPPKPAADPNFNFNYAPYLKNPERLKARFGTTDPTQLPQPSMDQQAMIRQYFPTDATRAAVLRLTEDRLNDNPPDYTGNANGSVDSGAYMNNSNTFADMMTRPVMAKRIANRGITSFADL